MTPINDIATIQHMLLILKDRLDPTLWDETPLPVIAAPSDWLEEVARSLGAFDEDGSLLVPETIHGCSVVRRDELTEAVLIDHDGRVYPIRAGWAATAEPMAPSTIVLQ